MKYSAYRLHKPKLPMTPDKSLVEAIGSALLPSPIPYVTSCGEERLRAADGQLRLLEPACLGGPIAPLAIANRLYGPPLWRGAVSRSVRFMEDMRVVLKVFHSLFEVQPAFHSNFKGEPMDCPELSFARKAVKQMERHDPFVMQLMQLPICYFEESESLPQLILEARENGARDDTMMEERVFGTLILNHTGMILDRQKIPQPLAILCDCVQMQQTCKELHESDINNGRFYRIVLHYLMAVAWVLYPEDTMVIEIALDD